MSENNENVQHSEELFNTEDLMQSEEVTEPNSEDYETQINDNENPENIETNEQLDTEDHNTEINEEDVMETDEHTEENGEGSVPKKVVKSNQERLTNLPLSKVKHIIKLDPDVNLVNSEAVYLITKTTEMFIKTLAKESFSYAAQNKKKTIAKNHVESALSMLPIEL